MVGIVKNRQEQLEKIRKKMAERGKGRYRDAHEFRIPKAKQDEKLNFFIRVLPELSKGEKCESGVSTGDYEFFFYDHGAHWIDRQKIECPRLHDGGKCDICQLGFDLLSETTDEDERKAISQKFLPRTYYGINVYFLNTSKNPEDLRGKVMWMSVPKTIYDLFDACMKNDDPGDEEDPKAFGMFYDVIEGFVFKLNATKKGDWNTYESSQFLASKGPTPLIAADKKGNPDEEKIQEILDRRHDLITKFEARDESKIVAIVKKLVNGDGDDDNEFDEDEEKKPSKSKPKPESKSESKSKPKDDDEDDVTEDVAEEPVDDGDADEEDDDEELANLLNDIKSSKD